MSGRSAAALPFTDVTDHWAYDSIAFVYQNRLFSGTSGTSSTTFAPDVTATRAMLMVVLARMDGADTAGGGLWYEKGMNWAKTKGVSDGTSPERSITREQLVTLLWRYAGSPALTDYRGLDGFCDTGSISSYAAPALAWAHQGGILTGKGDRLNPQGTATRAEVAVMLRRFEASPQSK